MNIQRRGAQMIGAIALGVLPLTLATPAFADPHTASLTVGPVVLPEVPIEACIDSSCTPSSPMAAVTLTAEATTDSGIEPVILTVSACPVGEVGAAIRVSSATATTTTIKATATGTGLDGEPKEVVVEETVTVDVPGVVVSACTTD